MSINQNELVKQFIYDNKLYSKEINEQVSLPGIKYLFKKSPTKLVDEAKYTNIYLTNQLKAISYSQISSIILDCICKYKNIYGFVWDKTKEYIKVFTVKDKFKFEQKLPVNETESNEILSTLNNILKTRPNIYKIYWVLGEDFVQVTYNG